MTAAYSRNKRTIRIIRISELASTAGKPGMLPVSPETIAAWVSESKFPKPIKLGDSVLAWDLDDVESFIAQLTEGLGQCPATTPDLSMSTWSDANGR